MVFHLQLGLPQSLSPVFILAFPLPQSSALVLGSHFAVAFPGPASHQLVSSLHSASPPWSLTSALLSWSGLFFSRVLPSPVVLAHFSGSCFMVLLLCLASAPGGLLVVCPWGSFSGREGCCALSVCLSCHAGCSGAGGAVLCWQCPGPRVQSEQEPDMGRGAQQLQGGGSCRSCCAKSKSTCTGHGSGTAQGCSFLHRLK